MTDRNNNLKVLNVTTGKIVQSCLTYKQACDVWIDSYEWWVESADGVKIEKACSWRAANFMVLNKYDDQDVCLSSVGRYSIVDEDGQEIRS